MANSASWMRYQSLWSTLIHVRWIHAGAESEEEDEILDKMDNAWSELTVEEQARVQAQPSQSIIKTEGNVRERFLADVSDAEMSNSPGGPLRVMEDAA